MLVITCTSCQFRFGIPNRVPAEKLKCPLCTRRLPPLAPGEGTPVDTGTIVSGPAPVPNDLDFTESDQTFFARLKVVAAMRAIRDWLLVPAVLTTVLAMCPMYLIVSPAAISSIVGDPFSLWPIFLMGVGYYLPALLILLAVSRLAVRRNYGFILFACGLAIVLMAGTLIHVGVSTVIAFGGGLGLGPDNLGVDAGNMWIRVIWVMLAGAVSILGLIGAVRAFFLLQRADVKAGFFS